MYEAKMMLNRSERQFWKMSPRKLNALVKAHIMINNPDEQEERASNKPTGYIDQIF
jgi:hypothetical protein